METTVTMPQIPTVIPSVMDTSSTKRFKDIEARTCPLCCSEVRLFYVNFDDKILMCENAECEFPFGHEELVFVKAADEIKSHRETDSQSTRSKVTKETLGSVISTHCWSEIEKLNGVYDSEDSQAFEAKALEPKEYMSLKHLKRKPKESIEDYNKSLKEIKELDSNTETHQPTIIIKNETFLKQLIGLKSRAKSKQDILLKPEEIKFVQAEPEPSMSEVVFDIKTVEGSLSTVTVNITELKPQEKSGSDRCSSGDPV